MGTVPPSPSHTTPRESFDGSETRAFHERAQKRVTSTSTPSPPAQSSPNDPLISPVVQNLTFRVKESITSLAVSPDKDKAAIVGKNTFRILKVTDGGITQQQDIYHSDPRLPGAAVKDVVWLAGSFSRCLLVAASDGLIRLYDLGKEGYNSTRLHQHNRQVHKLSINPFEPSLCLSGSQDGTLRLWDLRHLTHDQDGMRSSACFSGNSDAVRAVEWSPRSSYEFVMGTDSGVVQQWDIRKQNAPLKRVKAHDGPCHTVQLHCDGQHLLSGGADKEIKIFNMSASERRITPKMSLRAPFPIKHAKWRHAHRQTGRTDDSWRRIHIATSSVANDDRILFWDLRRPYNPIMTLEHYVSSPTSFEWQSDHVLWTTADDEEGRGVFRQLNIKRLTDLSKRHVPPPTMVSLEPDGTLWRVIHGHAPQMPNTAGFTNDAGPMTVSSKAQEAAGSRAKALSKFSPLEQDFELSPSTSWVRTYSIPGTFRPLLAMGELFVNLKPLNELPYEASSTHQHLAIGQILEENSRTADMASCAEVAALFHALSISVPRALERRAIDNRRRRTSVKEATFVSNDYKPVASDTYPVDASLVSSNSDVLSRHDQSGFDKVMLVWLFLNLFPSNGWQHSDENLRIHVIRDFHNDLIRTSQWDAACSLRQMLARVVPNVLEVAGFPNLTPAKIRDGTKECGLCDAMRDEATFVWCQTCGHSLHHTCASEWYMVTGEDHCPSRGCRCRCVVGI